MVSEPVVDGRRFASLAQELSRYAPHYTPELNLSDEQGVGPALMRIAAHLAETVLVRLGRTPHKHFVAFLDRLGISLLPATPARAAVTFKLAQGLNEVVRVAASTRVTAPGAEGDIPFETTAELMAIPGTLVAAYGTDPARDVIYPPPPGFLEQQIRTPTELVYEVQAFASAGTNRLQLDHVTELAVGSFLRIGGKEKVVVATIGDGNIITLADPLARAIEAETIVTPIRDFEVFDGIDVQEHVLYLGHADLFTVKEEATITLNVELVPNQAAPLERFDIAWQFWTRVDEDSPDAKDDWYNFEVLSDDTEGLSRSGHLLLIKPAAFEIKETPVNGVNSRWIRAELREKLPAGPRVLPEIDTITIGVKSGREDTPPPEQKGIQADQGFHNVTPLNVQVESNVGFFPFGTEPRQFDQFYVASKEAFSKKDALIRLDFQLDLQTVAAPSVVRTTTGLRTYSIGLRKRLYELDIATGNWQLLGNPSTDHPQGAGYLPLEDSTPSTITDATGDLIYAFVSTEDVAEADLVKRTNKVWVNFHRSNGTNKAWVDLDAPNPGTGSRQLKFNPAAIRLPSAPTPFARVFVVGGDDKLYSRDVSNTPAATADWQLHESPTGQTWASSPFATVLGSDTLVFITGADGIVHRLTLGATSAWSALTPSNLAFTAVSKPFAQAFGAAEAKVFVFGRTLADEWRLFECDTRNVLAGQFEWTDLGRPTASNDYRNHPEAHAPTGYVENPSNATDEENKHIFLRGADSRLYERLDEEATVGGGPWELRTRPGDPPTLRDSPTTYVDPGPPVVLHVISASGRNSVVAWEFEIFGLTPTTPPVTRQAVLLDETNASSRNGEYDGRTLTVTNTTTESRQVIAYEGARRLARLASPLSETPDSSFTAEIGTQDVGPPKDDTGRLYALHPPSARTARLIYLRVDGSLTDFDFYSRRTGVVSVDPATTPSNRPFQLYVELIPARTEFLSVEDASTVPDLSWEYWNGRGWLSLTVADGTRNFLSNGQVVFTVPQSLQQTEVAGQENFWIRARLVGGDYGRETFKIVNNTVVSEKSSLRPPKVSVLRIFYDAPLVPPGACVAFNNLDYLDQTAACQIGGAHFRPFEPLETFSNRSVILFLGFDKAFKTGPVRLLIDAVERDYDESQPPELDWRFRKDRRWKELDAEDGSVALTRQGILTLSASEELTRETRFGQSLYWIAGALRTDRGASSANYQLPRLLAIVLNTVWALQRQTIADEIAGSSDGEPGQEFRLQHAGVLDDEDIRVREALSAEEREQIEREGGTGSVVDREDIGGPWVRWRETSALFDAGANDRVYLLDRAGGVLQFGDGTHGRIPQAGVDNIRAFSYQTGGGAMGNVGAGEIQALGTAVTGIESVFNPIPAGGGSDTATTDAMLTFGPRRLSHRDRAVSADDFEELAFEASRQVAKVRCLVTTNLAPVGGGRPDPCDATLRHEARPALGWVSLIVVPDSPDARPCPSLELRRTVRDHLRERAPGVLAASNRIVVRPADYVEVGVEADIIVTSLEKAAAAERQARATLETLLHPLRGGPDGTGWEFGRPIWKSDVLAALKPIAEIDRVENLQFRFRGGTDPERVVIGPNELLASGRHVLAIKESARDATRSS